MERARQAPRSRAPRLLPLPYQLGEEPPAFTPMDQTAQAELGSLVYLSGATTGQNDSYRSVSNFIGNLNNQVYSQYMNSASVI